MAELSWEIEEERMKRVRDVDRLRPESNQRMMLHRKAQRTYQEPRPSGVAIMNMLARGAPASLTCLTMMKAQQMAIGYDPK